MSKSQIKFWRKDLENTQKSRFTKKRWFLLIDAAISLIILLVVIILLRHKPAGYNPQPVFEQQVSPYLTNQLLPQLYNGVQKKKPFELIIDQKGLNEAITSMGWPQMFNGLIISTPMVAFALGRLQMMAMVNYEGVDMVMTVGVIPRFDNNGLLNLQVDSFKIGAMSVTYLAKKTAKKMFNEQVQFIEPDNIASLAVASLLAEKPFMPVFELQGHKAKVDSILIEEKTLKVHIVPVEKIGSTQ